MEPSVRPPGVLDKAVAVLTALEGGPAGLAALVTATNLPRATCHRFAVSLEEHGLVRRDAEGRFCLGYRLVALGRAAAEAIPLRERARPVLADLQAATGESVQLFVRDGDRRVCVLAVESASELRTIVPEGARLPLDAGSAGKVLTGGLSGSHPWVSSVGEREAGVASVSAAVHDAVGAVVAAVCISGPIDRLGRRPGDRFGELVAAAARRLSATAA